MRAAQRQAAAPMSHAARDDAGDGARSARTWRSACARPLGLQQVRHEVGDVVAGRMQVKKSLIRRIREGKASKVERSAADEKTISIFTAEEVFDLAVKGNVLIRGWGGTLLLREVAAHPVRAGCAPMELRVKRLMERLETDDEAPRACIEIGRRRRRRAPRAWASTSTSSWGDPDASTTSRCNTERVPIADLTSTR